MCLALRVVTAKTESPGRERERVIVVFVRDFLCFLQLRRGCFFLSPILYFVVRPRDTRLGCYGNGTGIDEGNEFGGWSCFCQPGVDGRVVKGH